MNEPASLLAGVTLLQFMEKTPDRKAAEQAGAMRRGRRITPLEKDAGRDRALKSRPRKAGMQGG